MGRIIQAIMATACVTTPALSQVLNEKIKLTAVDGSAEDHLGISVAIDDGIIATGSYGTDVNGMGSGSIYLFDMIAGNEIYKILPKDGSSGDFFGWSIAMDSGIIVVGAHKDDASGEDSGSAYIFDAETGSELVKLTASGGSSFDNFGYSVAIENGIVVVGAPYDDDNGNSGSAYLFDAATGSQLAKLIPADGSADDLFGYSVAISNGVVVVGVPGSDENGDRSGSAYIFDAITGTQLFKLLPNDGSPVDIFGVAVAIENNMVVIGADHDDDNGSASGSAYLFDASTGLQLSKLLPSNGSVNARFGFSISLSNGIVAIGARLDDDNGPSSGSAFLFDIDTGQQIRKLLPTDGAEGDWFGYSIAIENGFIAVGSESDDDIGENSGSAYIFDANCPADLTGDFVLNFFDVSVFMAYFQFGDLRADFSGDGVLNFVDVSAFVQAFIAGCP